MARILLAGRDAYSLGFLARIARWRVGEMDVVSTSSGTRALDLLVGGGYSVGIVDQDLEDLRGTELIRRARWRCVATPLVLVASDASRALAVRARQVGAQDLLEKPVLVSRAAAAIRDFVAAERLPRGR